MPERERPPQDHYAAAESLHDGVFADSRCDEGSRVKLRAGTVVSVLHLRPRSQPQPLGGGDWSGIT